MSGVSIYELNKQAIKKLPYFDIIKLNILRTELTNTYTPQSSYLLYGKEIGYFSLFQYNESEKSNFGDTVIEILTDLSESKGIYSCEYKKGEDAWEIWIDYNDEPTVLYLFNYNSGIVYYG